VARAAGHLAEASRLLDEVALKDGAVGLKDGTLAVGALRRLPPARARNLLRYFLADCGVEPPGAARLEEALRQSLVARRDARVAIDLGGGQLMRHDGRLHVVRESDTSAPRYARRWRGEARLALPVAGGVLRFARGRGAGISLARLREGPVVVRPRQGGERFQPTGGRPRRTLKNLLQEARIPPWQRRRLPLIFCGSELVWVPGVGVAREFRAVAGEASVEPEWSWSAPAESR
jgi:tRNA(Ile)-lysidine synthase